MALWVWPLYRLRFFFEGRFATISSQKPHLEVAAVGLVELKHGIDVDPFVEGMETSAAGARHDDRNALRCKKARVGSPVFPQRVRALTKNLFAGVEESGVGIQAAGFRGEVTADTYVGGKESGNVLEDGVSLERMGETNVEDGAGMRRHAIAGEVRGAEVSQGA